MDLTTAAGGGLLVLAGGIWLASRPNTFGASSSSSAAAASNRLPTAMSPTLPTARPGLIAIAHDAHTLLSATGCLGLATQLRENLSLSPADFAAHVRPTIDAFARYVQMLPASEAHHHANPGGLLVHLMESATHASKLVLSYKLPKGATTEQQHKYKAHWAVGITLCALLHDVGKPIANLDIALFGSSSNRELKQWDGLSGSMTQYHSATHYSVKFAYSPYDAHTRLPVILLQSLVSEATRQWLEQAPGLLPAMMAYLDGNAPPDDAIREIVTLADQHSVKNNLAQGPKSRFTAARAVPMVERMLGGVRGAIADETLPLNRAGAAGFVDETGEHVYFVAGTVIEAARQWLEANETRQMGAAGLPTDNTRWFDTFQEHGALLAHPGGGAIWPVNITIRKPDGSVWQNRLTTLKFPIRLLFAEGQHPAPIQGKITLETSPTSSKTTAPLPAAASIPVLEPMPTAQAAPSAVPALNHPAYDDDTPTVAIATPTTAPTALAGSSATDDAFSALQALMGMAVGTEQAPSPAPERSLPLANNSLTTAKASSRPPASTTPPTPNLDDGDGDGDYLSIDTSARLAAPSAPARKVLATPPMRPADEHTDLGGLGLDLDPVVNHFLSWLQNGISRGDMPLNQSTGIAHVVPEGLALLSPRVYTDFVEQNPHLLPLLEANAVELGKETKKSDKAPYRRLQRRVENSGLLRINTNKSKLHTYIARTNGGKMSMVIVAHPQRFIHPLPPENDRITRTSAAIVMD